jgi:hypothetical protein
LNLTTNFLVNIFYPLLNLIFFWFIFGILKYWYLYRKKKILNLEYSQQLIAQEDLNKKKLRMTYEFAFNFILKSH